MRYYCPSITDPQIPIKTFPVRFIHQIMPSIYKANKTSCQNITQKSRLFVSRTLRTNRPVFKPPHRPQPEIVGLRNAHRLAPFILSAWGVKFVGFGVDVSKFVSTKITFTYTLLDTETERETFGKNGIFCRRWTADGRRQSGCVHACF